MPVENSKDNKAVVVKHIYYYLVSFVALMMIVISSVAIVDTALKVTAFSQADRWYGSSYFPGCDGTPTPVVNYAQDTAIVAPPAMNPTSCAAQKARQRQEQDEQAMRIHEQELAWSIAMFVVALPLFAIHWKFARNKKD
jgi:hypothetical protein